MQENQNGSVIVDCAGLLAASKLGHLLGFGDARMRDESVYVIYGALYSKFSSPL